MRQTQYIFSIHRSPKHSIGVIQKSNIFNMKKVFIILALLAITLAQEEKPTKPTKCSATNQGRCECGNESVGITTYTFWQGDEQRCFHVYVPEELEDKVGLPVAVFSNCYAEDSLKDTDMKGLWTSGNKAAARYGFVRIAISSPRSAWVFGNDNAISDQNPLPCRDEDSQDIAYVRIILDWVKSNPKLNEKKMYAWGHSQNSVFSSYVAYCFPDNFAGVYQSGAALTVKGTLPVGPACQTYVKSSDYSQCRNEGLKKKDCSKCAERYPCDQCQYWPIYPCYNAKRPMINCITGYNDDPYMYDTKNPEEVGNGWKMYNAANNEGHEGRMFEFTTPSDGSFTGGHNTVKNTDYWRVGCLGITKSCSKRCEKSFVSCIEESTPSKAIDRANAFKACIDPDFFELLQGCKNNCSPTFEMLSAGESPTKFAFENFGGKTTKVARPDTSKCSM